MNTMCWAIISSVDCYIHARVKAGRNIRFCADTGQDKSLVMKMHLVKRPRMGLSRIKLSKADEELYLTAVFYCEKA